MIEAHQSTISLPELVPPTFPAYRHKSEPIDSTTG